MTIRDQYALAFIQAMGPLLCAPKPSHLSAAEVGQQIKTTICSAVDLVVAEACARWGHIGEDWQTCERCGAGPRGKRPPPMRVRIPGHPIGCPCCTDGAK